MSYAFSPIACGKLWDNGLHERNDPSARFEGILCGQLNAALASIAYCSASELDAAFEIECANCSQQRIQLIGVNSPCQKFNGDGRWL
ncbi:MAG: hypothetical protein GDYSWBUE_001453 [Candidatus Fervidibacterota bacterium]